MAGNPTSSGHSRKRRERTDHRRALGAEGEARAARYLARRGYRIVERNVRVGGVEVDIIAARCGLVAFVEVKTRSTTRFGPPEAAVDEAKQARLVHAAAAWLHENPGAARRVRFDVITCQTSPVDPDSGRGPRGEQGPRREWKLVHWAGAFDAQP